MERLPAGRLPLVQPCHVTHPGYAHHRRPGPVISGLIHKRTDGLIIWSLKTFTPNSSRATRHDRALMCQNCLICLSPGTVLVEAPPAAPSGGLALQRADPA